MSKGLHFGKAFPDQLNKFRFKSNHFSKRKMGGGEWQMGLFGGDYSLLTTNLNSSWRRLIFMVLVLITFSALFIRLFHLQVVEGASNRDLADSNRIQVKVIHAPRGVIYDRNGKILAQNEPGFRLVEATPSGTKITHLSRDESLKLEVDGDPRIKDLEIDNIRNYPMGSKLSHVLGYVGEITSEELESADYKDYKLGDYIGRGGIEQSYERILRGIDGGEIIEVDAQGKKLRTLRKTDAIPGQNLILSIDASLQEVAYKHLEEQVKKSDSCCGAVVIQNPTTGEILGLVSYPSFDPKNLSSSLIAPNSPILNRAIGGTYPPGSTFKIASGLAGLSSGKITAQTQIEDTGVVSLGPFKFANWYFTQYGRTEGAVDLRKALKRSNDIYFYQLGQIVGEGVLADGARKLGMGKRLGIDIPGEEEGLVPDDAWKRKNVGVGWYPGDTLHMSIGQGFVLTTPLQISNLISAVAANGKQYPPHLVLKVVSPAGNTIKEFKYDGSKNMFKDEDINLVKSGLEDVPKDGGTAWPFFTFPIPTAGKTGTAEFGHPKNRTHAWYTAYAPLESPSVAVTALVEAGGEGSSVTAPIVKEIFRWYFSEDKTNLLKDISPVVATDSARTLGE